MHYARFKLLAGWGRALGIDDVTWNMEHVTRSIEINGGRRLEQALALCIQQTSEREAQRGCDNSIPISKYPGCGHKFHPGMA